MGEEGGIGGPAMRVIERIWEALVEAVVLLGE